MPPRPLYPRINRMLDGRLASLLHDWRASEMSYQAMADTLFDLTGFDVSEDTVRRWCVDEDVQAS